MGGFGRDVDGLLMSPRPDRDGSFISGRPNWLPAFDSCSLPTSIAGSMKRLEMVVLGQAPIGWLIIDALHDAAMAPYDSPRKTRQSDSRACARVQKVPHGLVFSVTSAVMPDGASASLTQASVVLSEVWIFGSVG